jgi:hypothetical protein
MSHQRGDIHWHAGSDDDDDDEASHPGLALSPAFSESASSTQSHCSSSRSRAGWSSSSASDAGYASSTSHNAHCSRGGGGHHRLPRQIPSPLPRPVRGGGQTAAARCASKDGADTLTTLEEGAEEEAEGALGGDAGCSLAEEGEAGWGIPPTVTVTVTTSRAGPATDTKHRRCGMGSMIRLLRCRPRQGRAPPQRRRPHEASGKTGHDISELVRGTTEQGFEVQQNGR